MEKRPCSDESGKIEMLRALVLENLQGRLWHTTNSERFQGILRSGAILPEPDIEDSERWGTPQGSEFYPYVRTLGGVSLFDFREFAPEQYSKAYPMSDWMAFVPYQAAWKEAVWIQIDARKLGKMFLSGVDLLARWKAESSNIIMPGIEAAYIGELPRIIFKNVFLVREGIHAFLPIEW
jgi:hypothetical protein